MNKHLWILISALLVASMLLASCAPQATPAPEVAAETEAPAAEEPAAPAATEPPAPAATEPPAPVATEPPASEPKVLKVRMGKDIGNLDPAFIVGSEDDMVDRAIMEGLVRYNAAGEMENQL